MKSEIKVKDNLTVKLLRKLFSLLCIHKKEYKESERFPDAWTDCKSCILRNVEWQLEKGGFIFRDLCFAIWHEDILNQK